MHIKLIIDAMVLLLFTHNKSIQTTNYTNSELIYLHLIPNDNKCTAQNSRGDGNSGRTSNWKY